MPIRMFDTIVVFLLHVFRVYFRHRMTYVQKLQHVLRFLIPGFCLLFWSWKLPEIKEFNQSAILYFSEMKNGSPSAFSPAIYEILEFIKKNPDSSGIALSEKIRSDTYFFYRIVYASWPEKITTDARIEVFLRDEIIPKGYEPLSIEGEVKFARRNY